MRTALLTLALALSLGCGATTTGAPQSAAAGESLPPQDYPVDEEGEMCLEPPPEEPDPEPCE